MSSNFSVSALSRVFNDSSHDIRGKVIGLYILLIGFNLLAWLLAFAGFAVQYPALLGVALLAYTFGLRHSVDADHISAIDNVTRKLMQENKRPVAVGFFFSLGHSTIVVLLSALVAVAASIVQSSIPRLQGIGSLISTGVSALFLYVIGIINLLVLIDIFQMFRRVTRGGTYHEETLDQFLAERGMMNRFFGPLVRAIDRSWKMYPLGVLFGLGFDTASEVALLGIAAATAGKGMPVIIVMLFPLLFAAGMSLVDTTDSILMLGAYGWAFLNPARKLGYNATITSASVLTAVLVGTIELSNVAGGGAQAGWLGFAIVGSFAAIWGASAAVHAFRRYGATGLSPAMETAPSNGAMPSAASQASRCLTYAVPNESASALTYDS